MWRVAAVDCTTAKRPKPLSAVDRALLDTAENGNIEAVKQHLAAGTDVNAKNRGEGTPLHLAARSGNKEIVELLIAKGADVKAKDKYGRTALHEAIFYFHKETGELLIAKGADVNAKSDDGSGKGVTPLDMAILNDETETADLLRKHDCDCCE